MTGKAFKPTDDQRWNVKALAGYGMTEPQIAAITINPATGQPVTTKTLRKHFREELDTGHVVATAKVAENLYHIATSKTHSSAVTAAIFWMKCRAHWQSVDRYEHTGKDGGPIEHVTREAVGKEIGKLFAEPPGDTAAGQKVVH